MERTIRHAAEPVLILAHENRDALLAADVRIDYAARTANYDPAASKVTFKSIAIDKGDVDKGFAGAQFEAFLREELGAQLIRPDRKDEPARFGKLARVRQWIESIIDTAKGQLTLEQHGARILAGVYARVAARLLALAAAIWHNWRIGAPVKRSLIAYDS